MNEKRDRFIKLTRPIREYPYGVLQNADLIIRHDGVVIKDRAGVVPREPTEEELKLAVEVQP